MIPVAGFLLAALLTWASVSVWRTWQFRRHLAQVEAARAAEAPCEAPSHVRIIPQGPALPEPEWITDIRAVSKDEVPNEMPGLDEARGAL